MRRLGLSVDPLKRVVGPDLRPVALRERGEGAEVLLGVFEHVSDDVEATLELTGDLVELRFNGGSIGLGEDRPDQGRDHLAMGLWDSDQDVPHEVNPATLPGRANEDLLNSGLEPQVRVRDDELDADKPPSPEALQELGPEDLVLLSRQWRARGSLDFPPWSPPWRQRRPERRFGCSPDPWAEVASKKT